MKIAALYDIHGNLPALNAVLEELEEVQPDMIIIGGDIVSGPMPSKTLKRLSVLGNRARFIRGNGDREAVMAFDGKSIPYLSEKGLNKQRWVADQLMRFERDFLARLPEQAIVHTEGWGEILFCHATPTSDMEIFTPLTSKERLAAIFNHVDQQLVVCGHTHLQFKLQVGGVHILNAGSVGMPFADLPGAYWLLLYPGGYEFRRTTYDAEAAAKEVVAGGDPDAREFVKNYILQTLTVKKGMEILEMAAKNQGPQES
ncbi:metallophosphoesterase family protein [Fictibacillus gelatini]|uniref:metallophosphoesterase family protein n=1 Tax=Fictibacillus gelatini TaxID=225985 RepID=UPI0004272923|nr:metallophosphoesterase family protein [Fictibacillus gelatini]